jgi:hypothetical protein
LSREVWRFSRPARITLDHARREHYCTKRSGSPHASFKLTDQCRCAPVTLPVLPTLPSTSPVGVELAFMGDGKLDQSTAAPLPWEIIDLCTFGSWVLQPLRLAYLLRAAREHVHRCNRP